jgi:hypothetical protein
LSSVCVCVGGSLRAVVSIYRQQTVDIHACRLMVLPLMDSLHRLHMARVNMFDQHVYYEK